MLKAAQGIPVFVICATYSGNPPDNAVKFCDWLRGDLANDALARCRLRCWAVATSSGKRPIKSTAVPVRSDAAAFCPSHYCRLPAAMPTVILMPQQSLSLLLWPLFDLQDKSAQDGSQRAGRVPLSYSVEGGKLRGTERRGGGCKQGTAAMPIPFRQSASSS